MRTVGEGSMMLPMINGALVLDSKGVGNGFIVLAVWGKGGSREFITWYSDADGNCSMGHYFQDLRAALDDFDNRA